ncbi:hypothetical protein AB205_0215540 [Aquarana catesbeiana]|uniref:Uncharacterized protein n=1 Tax=Aquarana catesbeiana TaxID=8400 RepID=A0A2G9SGQ0_AQUCT|nr:hypothetical protein AB205_0215540 [Aquarana catesbeiana]
MYKHYLSQSHSLHIQRYSFHPHLAMFRSPVGTRAPGIASLGGAGDMFSVGAHYRGTLRTYERLCCQLQCLVIELH